MTEETTTPTAETDADAAAAAADAQPTPGAGSEDIAQPEADAPVKAVPRKRGAVAKAVAAIKGDKSADPADLAAAAEVLGCYLSEVASVDGDVASTTDGQHYKLTGTSRGDFVWLQRIPAPVASLLGGE